MSAIKHPTITVGEKTYRPTLWDHNRRRRLTVMDAVVLCVVDAHTTISREDLGREVSTGVEATLARLGRLRAMGLLRLVPLGREVTYGLTMKGRRTMEETRG